jgi:ribosomal protein S18 acetylase RimI-like enzyme
MTDFSTLDHPIWIALTTGHQALARANGLARRYASTVSPLAALQSPTPAAFVDLTALVDPEEGIGLFTTVPLPLPDEWQMIRTRLIDQMVCTQLNSLASEPPLALNEADIPEMLALTAATDPGPFRPDTIRMGRYFGVRARDGRLIAMAGERLNLEKFVEISAVCTDPEFRGQGDAKALVTFLAALILAEGKIPFLHVKSQNGAKVLYEKIGFHVRRMIHLTVIARR